MVDGRLLINHSVAGGKTVGRGEADRLVTRADGTGSLGVEHVIINRIDIEFRFHGSRDWRQFDV